MIKFFRNLKTSMFSYIHTMNKAVELNKKMTLKSLQNRDCYQATKSLIPCGYKIYSKNEEDGIIREIFNRIGVTNKFFVEIGVDDGLENNTLALLFDNWKGLWIEGSESHVKKIENGFSKTIARGQLIAKQAFVRKDNINQMISESIKAKTIDLLSIDIDGNDYHVFDAITCVIPRVLVIEYNGKFPPPVMYCMKYDENHVWDGSDNFGASLKFLELKLKEKGYLLVGCNLTGGNAFFVKEDLTKDRFQQPFSAEVHYEPCRYELAKYSAGHRPSYKTLENREYDEQ